MFYLGNFLLLLGMSGLGFTAEDFLVNRFLYDDYGTPDDIFFDLALAAIIIAAAVYIIITKWGRQHKHRKSMRIAGIIWGLIGVLTVFAPSDSFFPISDIFISLGITATGILITLYNTNLFNTEPQKVITQPPVEPLEVKPPEPEKPKTEIDRIIGKISVARKTKLAQNNPSFKTNLEKTAIYLKEMQDEGFVVNKNILEKISYLLDMYLDVEDNKVQTEKSKKVLTKIMDSFDLVTEALMNVYDQNFNKTAMDIESEIDALAYKLANDGLLDSDFDHLADDFADVKREAAE